MRQQTSAAPRLAFKMYLQHFSIDNILYINYQIKPFREREKQVVSGEDQEKKNLWTKTNSGKSFPNFPYPFCFALKIIKINIVFRT